MRSAVAGLASGALLFSFALAVHGQSRTGPSLAGSLPAQAIGNAFGQQRSFNRIATFANYTNQPAVGTETVSEIVAASANGRTLVYTDAETGSVGFVDITNPEQPLAAGLVALPGDDAEPTSVDVLGNRFALVAVNSSANFIDVSGQLVVIDLNSHAIVSAIELGGQPDSLKVSPDMRYAAIVIENERDEEICVGGSFDANAVPEDDDAAADTCEDGGGEVGVIPQNGPGTAIGNPAGTLLIVDTASWSLRGVDLTGLAGCYAPSDPEPEFVDINHRNQAVVSLQENNCVAIVDLASGLVMDSFDAGTVDLADIDHTEEGVIALTESLFDVPREPDAITWIGSTDGEDLIATANEGDMRGGSRGFSIFGRDGTLQFDSGNALEHLAVRLGHYPEDRSKNKGTEPESIEFGRFAGEDYLFVGSERGSFVAVFRLDRDGMPVYAQTLPAPLGPEGVLAIPNRNLLVASGEVDDPAYGVRSTMMIYRLESGDPRYPELESGNDAAGKPIPWSAMSGMTAKPDGSGELLAVWDSYYSESRIFTVDPSLVPARVTAALTIQGGSGNFDPEGIAVAGGDYWVASEGNASANPASYRPNRLLRVDASGLVTEEILLPAEIETCRQRTIAAIAELAGRIATLQNQTELTDAEAAELGMLESLNLSNTLGSGFEGVAAVPAPTNAGFQLLLAQQRGWNYRPELNDYTSTANQVPVSCEGLDDDAGGLNARGEPLATRLWLYDPESGSWVDPASPIVWELAPLTGHASWVGLSEISLVDDVLVLIERDNRTGDWTSLKTLVRVALDAIGDGVASADKSVFDLLPAMRAGNGWVSDKPEGVAIDAAGAVYLVTDNDGVEDWSGETSFLRLGQQSLLFP